MKTASGRKMWPFSVSTETEYNPDNALYNAATRFSMWDHLAASQSAIKAEAIKIRINWESLTVLMAHNENHATSQVEQNQPTKLRKKQQEEPSNVDTQRTFI